MQFVKQMLKDVVNVGKTRKFWVGLVGAAAQAALYYLEDYPEFAPLFALLTALGVYTVPNRKK